MIYLSKGNPLYLLRAQTTAMRHFRKEAHGLDDNYGNENARSILRRVAPCGGAVIVNWKWR